ncbi:MAG TPA: PKD domain-containing protein, partial [Solirubrobacter sp.]
MGARQGRCEAFTLVVVLVVALFGAPAARAQIPTATPTATATAFPGSEPDGCSSAVGDADACDASRPKPRVSAVPSAPRTGADFTLSVYSPGRGLTYAWDTDDDGLYDDGTTKELVQRFASPGTHLIRVRVTDEDGRQGLAEGRIAVHAGNRAPAAELDVWPTAPAVGTKVTIGAYSGDSDGEVRSIVLDLDGDGAFETTPADPENFVTTFATAGKRTIRARFTDDGGVSTTASTTVDVHSDNLPPVASL